MIRKEFWAQVPTLNTKIDFTNLPVALSDQEIKVLSRINGLISLDELGTGLQIEKLQMETIAAKLVKYQMIILPDRQIAKELLDEVYGGKAGKPQVKAKPAAKTTAEPAAETTAEPTVAPVVQRMPAPLEGVEDESGEWDLTSLFSLINAFHRQKRRGVLRLYANPETYKVMFFDNGELIHVSSVPFDASECLGRLMQRAGHLDQNKVIESLQRVKESGRKQGEELIIMKAARPDRVAEMLRIQVEIKLTDLMTWNAGQWHFRHLPSLPHRLARIEVDLARLLFNLLWKRFPGERIERELNSRVELFVGRRNDPVYDMKDLGFGDSFSKFYEIVSDRDNPLKRLQVVSNLKSEETSRMIWTMFLLGFFDFFTESREDRTLAKVEELKNRLKTIERETLFDVLSVHWTASDQIIQQAYEKRLMEQKDAIAKTTGLVQRLNTQLLGQIETAHERLKTQKERRAYRLEIFDADFIEFGSDILRQKGESYLFTKEDQTQAITELQAALEVYDKNGEYWSEYGLALFFRDYPRNIRGSEEARRYVKRGLSMLPDSEITNFCMGLMHKHEKKNNKALEFLEKSIKINPKNKFAQLIIEEIKTGKKSDEYDQALRQFLDRRSQADSDFEARMAAKRYSRTMGGSLGGTQPPPSET